MYTRHFLLSLYLFIASLSITLGQAGCDGVTRILAIGNSFSEDAIENYLHELGVAANKEMVVGNLYIGGASLSLHWENILSDSAAYRYRKIGVQGEKYEARKVSIRSVLVDEPWDYISVQQASSLSGQFDYYKTPLAALFGYLKGATDGRVKVIFHQTWAYAADASHAGFTYYDRDQLIMYGAIMEASRQAAKWVPIDLLVPAGTAIQNARTSFIGDNLTRDGYHLDFQIGRFTAACTWFEALFRERAPVEKFRPEHVSAAEAEVAKRAAQAAVARPYTITFLTGLAVGQSRASRENTF